MFLKATVFVVVTEHRFSVNVFREKVYKNLSRKIYPHEKIKIRNELIYFTMKNKIV